MANKLSRAFDWGFYNVWQKIEWALFPLLALGIVGWCLSALYWSPDPVNEKYLYSPGNSPYFLSNKTSDVLWFTQISDVHIGKGPNKEGEVLEEFLSEELQTIQPEFTVVTGDITNSLDRKFSFFVRAKQQQDEWKIYKRLLSSHSLWDSEKWVDIPGNHDVMGVLEKSATNNNKRYFMSWEKMRSSGNNAFEYVTRKNNTSVRIIAMDLASYPGITMSYAGDGNSKVVNQVREMLGSSDKYTHTFLASHFCFPLIESKKWSSFEREIGGNNAKFTAHLCGHSHYTSMYSRNNDNHLQIELADLNKKKAVRVIAVDNGVFSFEDKTMGEWPFAVVTNPKPAYELTEADPLRLIQDSTHIRALIWHNKTVGSVKAYIDGELVCADMKRAESGSIPLFTCEWDPERYKKGLHKFTLSVEEVQKNGDRGETFVVGSHSFSLDGTGERDSGFVGMFLGLPLIQWALAFMVSGVCVTTLYMLVIPQVYGLTKDRIGPRWRWRRRKKNNVIDEREGEEEEEEKEGSVERLLAQEESPYKYFVKEGSLLRTVLLAFWPTVTTFQTMSQVPMVQLLSSFVACLAPLVMPLAFGPAGPPGMCVFMGWGWTFCKGGAKSIEFFTLLGSGCYYYVGVMPCLLVTGAQVRVIQSERARRRSFGKKVSNAIFEFWCFAVTFLFDVIFFFFFLVTSGTLTAFMTPCLWVLIAYQTETCMLIYQRRKFLRLSKKSEIEENRADEIIRVENLPVVHALKNK